MCEVADIKISVGRCHRVSFLGYVHMYSTCNSLCVPKTGYRTFPNDKFILDICCKKISLHQSLIETSSSRAMETDANGWIKLLQQPLADLSNRPLLPEKSSKGTRHNPKIFSYVPASQLPNHGEALNGSEHNSNDTEGHLGHIAYSFFTDRNPA